MKPFIISDDPPEEARKAGMVCELVQTKHPSAGGPVAIAWFRDYEDALFVQRILTAFLFPKPAR